MGVVLAVAGGVFTGVLWRSYQRAEETRGWVERPCSILSSTLKVVQATASSPSKYAVGVRYSYVHEGVAREGSGIRRTDSPIGDLEKATALRESYTPGQSTVCWVNPAVPEVAILRHETRAGLYTIWFPLFFVFGGLKMSWDAGRKVVSKG